MRYLTEHQVWSVTGSGTDWSVHSRTDDAAGEPVRARAVLLATGAYERQLPFPGWTLPGVVGAGGAQAMFKSGLVLPGRRVVVAGSGPLLLAVAASLAAAGARVPAVVEAAGYGPYVRHTGTLPAQPGQARRRRPVRRGVAPPPGPSAAPARRRRGARNRPGRGGHRRPARPRLAARARHRPGASPATRSPSATAWSPSSPSPPPWAAPPAPPPTGPPPSSSPRACGPRCRGLGGGRDGWRRRGPARPGRRGRSPPRTVAGRAVPASLAGAGTGCGPSPTRWAPPPAGCRLDRLAA
ncbi:hypothetical protein [Streptomyces hydrogenans]|uniref:hypothetical protein n=1 Tax=Streptomyces hydrogenans TaxID=1873719 RepID=UPI0035592871